MYETVRFRKFACAPIYHHDFKLARRIYDTRRICYCFTLSCYANVLMYRNIHFSKIELRM